jgi:hypothetical protein
VGSDQSGGMKITFNIVWRGDKISQVDHRALL